MNPNVNELINESIKIEDDFSSSSHAIDKLVVETEPAETIYTIPDRYNKDTLRVLLVNTKKYYVYWEVSDETLEKNNLDLNKDELCFKVFKTDGSELSTFTSTFALGEHFINLKFENIKVFVKIGFIDEEEEFVEFKDSNEVQTFSSQINLPEESDAIWVKKNYAWTEVVRSTMENVSFGSSSSQYVKELERLKHFTQTEEEKLSSSSIHQGTKND